MIQDYSMWRYKLSSYYYLVRKPIDVLPFHRGQKADFDVTDDMLIASLIPVPCSTTSAVKLTLL